MRKGVAGHPDLGAPTSQDRTASAPLAGFTLQASGALSTASFRVLTVAAFALAGGYGNSVLLVAGPLLLLGVGVLVRWVSRHQRSALIRTVERALRYSDTLRRRAVSTGPDRIQALVAKLALIQPRKRDWVAGFAFAATNWLAYLLSVNCGKRRVVENVYLCDARAN